MEVPKASNCSPIWNANSLVGVRIRAKSFCGVSKRACKIGKANAAVLPELNSFSLNVQINLMKFEWKNDFEEL